MKKYSKYIKINDNRHEIFYLKNQKLFSYNII